MSEFLLALALLCNAQDTFHKQLDQKECVTKLYKCYWSKAKYKTFNEPEVLQECLEQK